MDCTRRKIGGAGATGTARVDKGRGVAVPSSACVVTGAATGAAMSAAMSAAMAMDGIRFEGGTGGVGLDCHDEKCQGDCPEIAKGVDKVLK